MLNCLAWQRKKISMIGYKLGHTMDEVDNLPYEPVDVEMPAVVKSTRKHTGRKSLWN